jgi:hypothetical protein
MKPVDVVFQKVEVTDFDARTGIVSFRVIFNDGKPKAIARNQKIEVPAELSEEIFKEIRSKLKEIHDQESIHDDSPLAGVVLIRIKGDEELIMERMSKFFATIKEKIRNAQAKKLPYVEVEKQIKGLKTDL